MKYNLFELNKSLLVSETTKLFICSKWKFHSSQKLFHLYDVNETGINLFLKQIQKVYIK